MWGSSQGAAELADWAHFKGENLAGSNDYVDTAAEKVRARARVWARGAGGRVFTDVSYLRARRRATRFIARRE